MCLLPPIQSDQVKTAIKLGIMHCWKGVVRITFSEEGFGVSCVWMNRLRFGVCKDTWCANKSEAFNCKATNVKSLFLRFCPCFNLFHITHKKRMLPILQADRQKGNHREQKPSSISLKLKLCFEDLCTWKRAKTANWGGEGGKEIHRSCSSANCGPARS